MVQRALLALAMLVTTGAVGAQVEFGSMPALEALPGEYLTFAVPISGDGSVTVVVTAPDGWHVVTDTRELQLRGTRQVPFTVRVPATALAGTRAQLELSATGEAGRAQTSIGVTVGGSAGVSVTETTDPQASPNEVLAFEINVTNAGNQPEVISLRAYSASRQVHVSPTQLVLEPFQSAAATVSIPVQGTVGQGYRMTVTIEATSGNTGGVTTRDVTAVYRRAGTRSAVANPDPRLLLRITSGVNTGVEVSEEGAAPFLNWSVQPGLSGELSDFVQLNVSTGSFRNAPGSVFSAPQHARIELTAQEWQAAITFGHGRFGLSGAMRAAGWRFNVGGHYFRPAEAGLFQLQAGAVSQTPGLDLQFHGNLMLAGEAHSESLSGLWRRALSNQLQLGIGLGLSGYADAQTDYRLYLTVNQNLRWLTQNFDLVQSISTTPGLGQHSVSLTGGSRSAGPFGIRFLARLNVGPTRSTLSTGVQLTSVPVQNLRLSAGVIHSTADFGAGPANLRLQAGAAMRFSAGSGAVTGSISGNLESSLALNEHARPSNGFRITAETHFRKVSLRLGVSRDSRAAHGEREAELRVVYSLGGSLALGPGSEVEASFNHQRGTMTGTSFAIRWRQEWSARLSSDVTWRVSARTNSFAIGVAATDIFTPGLNLGFGYGLVLTPAGTTHRFSAGISYTWLIPFSTPAPLVDAFGGRETGGFTGVAFIDRNLDGQRDITEERLAGITIVAGDTATVTQADGSFNLRVPPGPYTLEFKGLPATLGFTGDPAIEVHLNSVVPRDLSFSPVSTMRIVAFADLDRDGQPGVGEPFLPGIQVELQGPRTAHGVTDSSGTIWITNLTQGSYTPVVNQSSLPAGHELTRRLQAITVEPPAGPPVLYIPVAPLIRDVVTTFQSGTLALVAWTSDGSTVAGRNLTVFARVHGEVDTVQVELFDEVLSLLQQGDVWIGHLTVPPQAGMTSGVVRATGAGQQQEVGIQVFVTLPE